MQIVIPILSARNKSPQPTVRLKTLMNGYIQRTPPLKYRLLADSNMHCMLNFYFDQLVSGEMHLAVPNFKQIDDLADFTRHFPDIQLVECEYRGNAIEQRWAWWADNVIRLARQGYTKAYAGIGNMSAVPIGAEGIQLEHYWMNVSTQTGLEQPIDALMPGELDMLKRAKVSFVHNQGQIDWLVQNDTDFQYRFELPKLSPKGLLFNESFYKRFEQVPVPECDLLLPFKLEVAEYAAELKKAIELIGELPLKVCYTNPNNADTSEIGIPSNWLHVSPSKEAYYSLLRQRPAVFLPASLKIWHVAKVELTAFGCQVYTKASQLVAG